MAKIVMSLLLVVVGFMAALQGQALLSKHAHKCGGEGIVNGCQVDGAVNGACTSGVADKCESGSVCLTDTNVNKDFCYRAIPIPGDRCFTLTANGNGSCGPDLTCFIPDATLDRIPAEGRCHCPVSGPEESMVMVLDVGTENSPRCITKDAYEQKHTKGTCSDGDVVVISNILIGTVLIFGWLKGSDIQI